MASLRYHLDQAASCLRHSPYGAVVAASTMAVALSLASLALVAGRTVESVLEAVATEARITVFVRPEVDASNALALAAAKAAGPGAQATLVLPGAALLKLKMDLGAPGRALDGLAKNPLPASLEVRLPAARVERLGLAEVRRAAQRLSKLPFASEVDFGQPFIARVKTVLLATRAIGVVVFGVALLVALFLVSAVVRLSVYARRDEIEILRLVGATDGFISAPFVLEGAAQGLVGGLVAALFVGLFERLAVPALLSHVGFAREIVLPSFGPWRLAGLVVAGGLFGVLASVFAVVRFLRRAA